jgi:hypothetical protein
MIDLIIMIFIPIYKAMGPFLFFISLLMMVWNGFQLVVTFTLRIFIIVKYRVCSISMLAVFSVMLFQLAVSPFNRIGLVMEEVA